jgi:hypothetical protein
VSPSECDAELFLRGFFMVLRYHSAQTIHIG